MSFQVVSEEEGPSSTVPTLKVGIDAWGYSRLTADEIAGLRKVIPAWAVADAPGHFFKYSDEQTIMAVQAISQAITRLDMDLSLQSDWAVIAAPQFLGRIQGANMFHRFLRDGAPGVSPHMIPQHSLHSVSGAISVLMKCHGPNLGVGGGPGAVDDAMLTAATLFESGGPSGSWLVCTAWDPEPLPSRDGKCVNEPLCHAFALAIKPAEEVANFGTLQIHCDDASSNVEASNQNLVTQIVNEMISAEALMLPRRMRWSMDWGATVELLLTPRVAAKAIAA